MAATAIATDDRRSRLYDALVRRNRLVSILRLAVPALGLVVLAVLLVQIVIDNLSEQFGFSNLHIDREHLVVDTPHLSSTAADGTLYAASAVSAKVSTSKVDVVELTDAEITMTPPDGKLNYTALAPAAQLQLGDQKVLVAGPMQISSTDGMQGTLNDVIADVLNSRMIGNGPVHIRFGDGSVLDADAMTYDGDADLFTFRRATVLLENLPEEAK